MGTKTRNLGAGTITVNQGLKLSGTIDPDVGSPSYTLEITGSLAAVQDSDASALVVSGTVDISGSMYLRGSYISSNPLIRRPATFRPKDDNSAASVGSNLFIVPTGPGGISGLYQSNANTHANWGSAEGDSATVTYNSDPATNYNGLPVYFDEDASSRDLRLLADATAFGGISFVVPTWEGRFLHVKHDSSAASNGVALYFDADASGGMTVRVRFVSPTNTEGSVDTSSTTSFFYKTEEDPHGS